MPEQFLDGSDVVPIFQQVGGEAVAKGVGGRRLVDPRGAHGFPDGALEHRFVLVVAPHLSRLVVSVRSGRGEDPLPSQFLAGLRVLESQRLRKLDPSEAAFDLLAMELRYLPELLRQIALRRLRQQRRPVLSPLAVPDDDEILTEVDVFDPKPQALRIRSPPP